MMKIKATVSHALLHAYSETLRQVGEDLYEIAEDNVGACLLDTLTDMSTSGEVTINTDFLKEELRWILTEMLVVMAIEAKEDGDITPQKCSAELKRYRSLYARFAKLADEAIKVTPWLIAEID